MLLPLLKGYQGGLSCQVQHKNNFCAGVLAVEEGGRQIFLGGRQTAPAQFILKGHKKKDIKEYNMMMCTNT